MNDKLIDFLSNFSFYEHERNLFQDIETYLMNEFLIRPLLVYSIQNNSEELDIAKSRTVLGKSDRLKLYSAKLLDEMLSRRNDIKQIPCLEVKVDTCYYYYLNLGVKSNQFYFSVFSAPEKVDIKEIIALSHFSKSHLEIIKNFDESKKAQELILMMSPDYITKESYISIYLI